MALFRYVGDPDDDFAPRPLIDGKVVAIGNAIRSDDLPGVGFVQVTDPDDVKPASRPAAADGSKFDHDGDGKPGGSKPKSPKTSSSAGKS